LIPALLEEGAVVRATSRDPSLVAQRYDGTTTVTSDLLDEESLAPALNDIEVAFYLVHSMKERNYEERDRVSAANFLRAAERAGVRRIVYLSGLGEQSQRLSSHLQSRQKVGSLLASGLIPVSEVRAAIVIGCGSIAFDMLRYLTERLPLMIAPRWLSTRIQPIAESDLVRYLVAEGSRTDDGAVIEVGGRDVLTYRSMILRYAAIAGLRRKIVSVPVLSPRLSSYWVDLMTPVSTSIARPLIDGLRSEVVVTDYSARRRHPHIEPRGYEDAVRAALERQVTSLGTALVDARPSEPGTDVCLLYDDKRVSVEAPPEIAARELYRLGGDPSWYPLGWAWWIRARLDSAFGGIGLKWQQARPSLVRGVTVDWWIVEAAGPRALLLRAQMRTPGEAWVAFHVGGEGAISRLRQVAVFRPRGLLGRLYWWLLLPFHAPIFRLMAKRIGKRMEMRP
jgi:uncharacterized protein YbjT (DUF2867 family)